MIISVRPADVTAQLRDEPDQEPYMIVKRDIAEGHLQTAALPPAGNTAYRILHGPIDAQHIWSLDKAGTVFGIPLCQYVLAPGPYSLMKFGMQYGAIAAALNPGSPLLILALSSPYTRLDGQPGFCVYAGAAAQQP